MNRCKILASTAAIGGLVDSGMAWSNDPCVAFTPEMQAVKTPEAALKRLQDGNLRFVAGLRAALRSARSTAQGQAPFAVVLGCIDSRVPPELVFDQNIGDMFVAH